MFKHEKQLLMDVKVDGPNPNYANMMQEQLGGPQGELKAAMQYISQSYRIKDQKIKDLFLDIGSEELGHMEMASFMMKATLRMQSRPNSMFLTRRRRSRVKEWYTKIRKSSGLNCPELFY
jgi:Mn-containing catalase